MQDFAENLFVFNTYLDLPRLLPDMSRAASARQRLAHLRSSSPSKEESCSNCHDSLTMLSHIHQQCTLEVVKRGGIQL